MTLFSEQTNMKCYASEKILLGLHKKSCRFLTCYSNPNSICCLAKRQLMDLLVTESSNYLPTCLLHTVTISHCLFNGYTLSSEAVNTNLYSFWFVSNRNRTRIYCFRSRPSICLTTVRIYKTLIGSLIHRENRKFISLALCSLDQ